jgi:hypothetical protein
MERRVLAINDPFSVLRPTVYRLQSRVYSLIPKASPVRHPLLSGDVLLQLTGIAR